MTNIIGIGETVYDIIFDAEGRPLSGRPGGSVFNALISLGRAGAKGYFVSEVGNDRIGQIIKGFLEENGFSAQYVSTFEHSKSALALAFLDAEKNAQYSFYKDYPSQRLGYAIPPMTADDIVLVGSYYALSAQLRPQVSEFLRTAQKADSLIYYDVNYRRNHIHELAAVRPTLEENYSMAHIVKGSDEDFENIYGTRDFREVYHTHIKQFCEVFICTCGSQGATLLIGDREWHASAQPIEPVSTIGAGDSFNAGTVYGLAQRGLRAGNVAASGDLIAAAMRTGVEFATEVCMSLENYIAKKCRVHFSAERRTQNAELR